MNDNSCSDEGKPGIRPASPADVRFPPRPPVALQGADGTRIVYETVEAELLRGLLEDLARFAYAQTHLSMAERHRSFARLAAAAAVNALLDQA